MKFPQGFLWGTASAAHQVEGNDINTEWWEWETRKKDSNQLPYDASGMACNFYHRYEEDFDLAKGLNNNAIRLSLAWNRIEPTIGKFDRKEIEHYRKVLLAANKRGLKVFLTLQHFTLPLWFYSIGGWSNVKSPQIFAEFARKCAKEFGDLVDTFITINEPQVYALMAYTNGTWPPHKKSYPLSLLVQINLMRAHVLAYKEIKKVIDKPVGFAKNIVWYEAHPTDGTFIDRFVAKFLYFLNCDFFMIPIKRYMDFVAVNFYFTTRLCNLKTKNQDDVINDMGWWVKPESLEKILLHLKKYKMPVYVTENGVADSKDKMRARFIRDMLLSCYKAISKGVNLKGYFHWSLTDNYEWHHGFWPRFGLVEIDYDKNFERKPRKSYNYYANICKSNEIDIEDNV